MEYSAQLVVPIRCLGTSSPPSPPSPPAPLLGNRLDPKFLAPLSTGHNGCGPNKTSFCGGRNNARNRVKTCLRWAIDAGAGLILHPVTMRGNDLINTNGEQQCLDAWWDLQTLQDALAVNCPQLQLCVACDGLKHTIAMLPLGGLADTATIKRPPHREVPDPRWAKVTFRQNVALSALQTAAESGAGATPASIPTNTNEKNGNMTIFEYGDAYLGWDYRGPNELDTILKELHLALPFLADLIELGDTIARSPQLHGGAFIRRAPARREWLARRLGQPGPADGAL